MPHSIISLSAVGYPSLYLIPTTLRQILSNLSSISPGSYFFLLPSSWEFFPLSCVRSSLSRILYLLSLFISFWWITFQEHTEKGSIYGWVHRRKSIHLKFAGWLEGHIQRRNQFFLRCWRHCSGFHLLRYFPHFQH